ncbi:MAG: diacylglycerol kinase family lipid kinase [Actinomycetota bacterium]|nr:diacylglycerol kinase family lipid kinase [Actinomycetota bacterium]
MDKLLLIANPNAGSVSARTKEVIIKALAADFKLEDAVTHSRDHASELARDAVDRGFDAVVAFGGDGTINEVAQPLVGTDVALGLLPGGSTNVTIRSLGIPRDPVEATALLSARLRSRTRRRINVGRVDARYFLFSAGMGLDAEVVKRVEADPEAKRRRGEWFFLRNALTAAATEYRGRDASITMQVEGGEPERVVLAVCANGRPFTYFKRFPVDVCPSARLDGALDLFAITKVRLVTIPRVAWGVLVSRSHVKWRNSRYFHDVSSARLTADEPLPVQVDGDYIGERSQASIELVPEALELVV